MRLPPLAMAIVSLSALTIVTVSAASGQTAPICPYEHGIPATDCTVKPNSDPIPRSLGGTRIAVAQCASTLIDALASMSSYYDKACPSSGLSSELIFVADGAVYLADPDRVRAEGSNFRAGLYCDVVRKKLILAYRGSKELADILNQHWRDDWVDTNLIELLGLIPIQFGAAENDAQVIKRQWVHGDFDGRCGEGHPGLVLTGHSKGGGEAQYAAIHLQLNAVVFNSIPVNPMIFIDQMLVPNDHTRLAQTVKRCLSPENDNNISQYYSSGNIRDVRMVNDIIASLVPLCDFPHAPIEWIANTLSCSSNGHAIETVVRELQACATH